MPVPTPPEITIPWAENGLRDPIPDAPSPTPGRASMDQGFPPITMQPIVAGGIPPFGQDANGILYMLSSHAAYINAGQPYLYSATISAAIAGYKKGTILGMSDGTGAWLNITDDNITDPDASGAGWVPLFTYGYTTRNALAGGTVTLTLKEASRPVIILNGVLTSNLTIVLPTQLRSWLIVNRTTGAFTTTVKTAAGTGVQVAQGDFSNPLGVYGNGTNLYPSVSPLPVPIAISPDPLTLAERSSNGYLLATYFNTNAAIENFTIDAVYAQKNTDGYIRKINKTNFAAQFALSTFAGSVLAAQVPQGAVTQFSAVLFASPVLTGTPTAPTQAVGNSSTRIATTQFANPGNSQAANGWVKFPGGIILQWGVVTFVGNGNNFMFGTHNFPLAFPGACFSVVATGRTQADGAQPITTAGNILLMAVDNFLDASFRWRADSNASDSLTGNLSFSFVAIGN